MIENEPYVGPRPFLREDRAFFFGRDAESNELASLITAHPAVLLYAQSGAGKTSLLNAKIIPMLERDDFTVFGPVRVTRDIIEGADYEKINLYISNALSGSSKEGSAALKPAQLSLAEYLKQTYPTEDGKLIKPCIIIFDQFEELFTFYPERWKDRRGFFEQIGQALEDPLLRVVFAMREDYIAELDPYLPLLPEKLRTRFRLERLRKKAAMLAVKEPLRAEALERFGFKFEPGVAENLPEKQRARFHLEQLCKKAASLALKGPLKVGPLERFGFEFEPGVADKLVDTLLNIPFKSVIGEQEPKGEYVETVQLQVVCRALWTKMLPHERKITYAHLQAHGDVNTALSTFYDECVQQAAKKGYDQEGVIRRWFENTLITETGRRATVFRGSTRTGSISNKTVDKLESLLIIRAEIRGGERWYELSHDRFIRPIKESNQRWLLERSSSETTRKYLEDKASAWTGDGELLDESDLAEAKRWLSSPVAAELGGFSNTLLGLIRASQSAIDAKKAAHQAEIDYAHAIAGEQQRRADAEGQKAEEHRRRADAERKRVKQLRWGLALLSLLLVAAITATIIAVNQRAIAKEAQKREAEQRQIAEQSAESEKEQKEIAQGEANEAERARAREEEQKQIAETAASKARAAEAIAQKAASVARAAQEREEDQRQKAEQATSIARVALAREEDQRQKAETAASKARAAEAIALQNADAAGAARTEAETQRSIAQQAANDAIRAKTEATESLDLIHMIDARNPHNRFTLRGHKADVKNATMDSEKKLILSASTDGTARIWKLNWNPDNISEQKWISLNEDVKGSESDKPDSKGANQEGAGLAGNGKPPKVLINSATLSPDGKLVATAREDETVRISDASTGKLEGDPLKYDASVKTVAFSGDSEFIVTGRSDGKTRVWNIKDRKGYEWLSGDAPISYAEFSPDRKAILTINEKKEAIIWNVEKMEQKPEKELLKMEQKPEKRLLKSGVLKAAFSPDSTLIVTVNEQDNLASLWDAKTGKLRASLKGHTGQINSAEFSKDGRYIVTASKDGTARVWRSKKSAFLFIRLSHSLRELREHTGLLLSYHRPEFISSLPFVAFSIVHKPELHNKISAAFSPYLPGEGKPRYVVTGGEDGTVKLWDLKTGRRITEFRGHIGQVNSVKFSTDGRFIISAGADATVRMWNPCKGIGPTDFKDHVCRYCEDIGVKPRDKDSSEGCLNFLTKPEEKKQ